MSNPNLKIIDATLREGNQAPGVKFTLPQAVHIAKLLERVGVDMIECGHAIVGPDERERIAALARLGLSVPLLSHARAREEDIRLAKASGAEWVGIFCGINRMSRLSRLSGKPQDTVIDMIRSSVAYAKSLGLGVRYTLEDSTRTPLELVVQVLQAACQEGADRVCYADTLGAMPPGDFSRTVATIREALPHTDLEVHVHDDRGFAAANAWVAMEAGATWISTAVNGLGERCGITDLATMLANLDISGDRPLVQAEALQELSVYVGAVSRSHPDARRPVVGLNAFTHTARLHTDAVRKNPLAYAIRDPARFGREMRVAPPAAVWRLEDLIVSPPVISATELKYHRAGPGSRFVMIDERFVKDARQYCIVRQIPFQAVPADSHVDPHRHTCDSLFMFLGAGTGMRGLTVEVLLDGKTERVESPAAMFIPSGCEHSYRVLGGEGLYVNHVLAGEYNGSLLEPGLSNPVSPDQKPRAESPLGVPTIFVSPMQQFLGSITDRAPSSFDVDMDLIDSGVIDSIHMLALFAFLEELTGLPIQVDSARMESVRTIRKIHAAFVESPATLSCNGASWSEECDARLGSQQAG